MKTIILISCCKDKLKNKAKAEDMYISEGFKLRLEYAKLCNPDSIFILSGKYGLLNLDTEIEEYNICLSEMDAHYQEEWADKVLSSLSSYSDLEKDKFIILAEESYFKNLTAELKHYETPFFGKDKDAQKEWLKKKINYLKETNMNEEIYTLLNNNLTPGQRIRNWTPYNGYKGKDIIIVSIHQTSITILPSDEETKPINVPFYEIAGIRNLWDQIVFQKITRHEYSHKNSAIPDSPFYFSRYCLDILKYLDCKGFLSKI